MFFPILFSILSQSVYAISFSKGSFRISCWPLFSSPLYPLLVILQMYMALYTIWKVKVKVAQLCPTLCKTVGHTVHGIFHARILEWVAISVQFSSVSQSCPTLCDPKNHSTPGLPVHHQLPESAQTHVHPAGGAIQPSHPLSSPAPSLSFVQYFPTCRTSDR